MCQRFLADKDFFLIYLSVMQHLNELKWGLGLAETNILWLIRRISPSRHCKTKDNSLSWTWRMNRWLIKLLCCCILCKEKETYKHIKMRARRVYFCHVETEAHQNLTLKKQKKQKHWLFQIDTDFQKTKNNLLLFIAKCKKCTLWKET